MNELEKYRDEITAIDGERAVTRKTVMPQRATFAHLCKYSSSEYGKYSSSS